MTLEDRVRSAVHERAGVGRVDAAFAGGIVDRALAGGRRRGRRRVVLTMAAGVVSFALLGTAIGLLDSGSDPVQLLPAVPAAELVPDRVTVAAYTSVSPAAAQAWRVADPTTGQYREVKGEVVAVSPDQHFAVIRAIKPLVGGVRDADPEFAIYDTTSGRTVRTLTFPVKTLSPLWSPDGRWLAFPRDRGENRADRVTEAVSFVEVTTGRTSTVEVDAGGEYEVEDALAWTSDSDTLLLSASGDKDDRLLYVRMSRAGALTRVKTEWRPKATWSRVGVSVTQPAQAIHWTGMDDHIRFDVLDLAGGRVESSYQTASFTGDVQWLDGYHYARTTGRQVRVHDARTQSAAPALTLPSAPAGPLYLAPMPVGAKTPSLGLG